jgi:NADH:ubiquinone oxidoreductase subunit 4 (subunit M)
MNTTTDVSPRRPRWGVILAGSLLFWFDTSDPGMQLAETVRWNPRLGTHYALGVDGISLPLVLLAALLGLVAILASRSIKERTRGCYILMLVLQSAMLGVFMAQDWALFYVFWELMMLASVWLIWRRATAEAYAAGYRYLLVHAVSGAMLLRPHPKPNRQCRHSPLPSRCCLCKARQACIKR